MEISVPVCLVRSVTDCKYGRCFQRVGFLADVGEFASWRSNAMLRAVHFWISPEQPPKFRHRFGY